MQLLCRALSRNFSPFLSRYLKHSKTTPNDRIWLLSGPEAICYMYNRRHRLVALLAWNHLWRIVNGQVAQVTGAISKHDLHWSAGPHMWHLSYIIHAIWLSHVYIIWLCILCISFFHELPISPTNCTRELFCRLSLSFWSPKSSRQARSILRQLPLCNIHFCPLFSWLHSLGSQPAARGPLSFFLSFFFVSLSLSACYDLPRLSAAQRCQN